MPHAESPRRRSRARELERLEAALPVTLSTEEVAGVFKVTPKTVRKWHAAGRLRGLPVRAGRRQLYTRDEVIALLLTGITLVFVVAVVGFAALTIACRLGVSSARHAMSWLTDGHPLCDGKHHGQRHGQRLYALAGEQAPGRVAARARARARRRPARRRRRRPALVRHGLVHYRRFSLGGKGRAPPVLEAV